MSFHEGAYVSLMRGLRELDLRGPCVPSDLVLMDHAFPLAMNSRGQVLMAASLYGRGRIVVLGHEGYLTTFPALVENALTWLRGDGSDNLSVGVHKNIKAVADNISKSSFQAKVVGAFSDSLGLGVYVTDAYSVGADVKDLVAFLKAGGGVLIAGQAWKWAASHPKENTLLQFAGNKVSGVAGIYFSKHQGEVECLPVYPQIPSSWMALCVGQEFEEDLEFLLQGVSEFYNKFAINQSCLEKYYLLYIFCRVEMFYCYICFSGNKILNKMGLSVLVTINKTGSYKPSQDKKDTNHFRHLLGRFAAHITQGEELTKHDWEQLNSLTPNFLNMKAYDSYSYTQVLSFFTDVLKKSGMPQVSEKNPVKSPKGRLLLSLGAAVYNTSPDPDALLPFLIKDIPLMIRINTNTAGVIEWISTGLYLSPGMKTKIIVPANIVNKSWTIQIGCQTDILKADELKRAPSVCERFPVTTEKMQVSNLWGGLIYLLAPPNTKVEEAEVIVQMAVLAPYYKSGESADWSKLRTAPSPWAELEFDNIILTVPSAVVRDLKRIDEVAVLWNDIMKGIADLAVIPHKFARKERIVADVQISAGLMHSGYPVMIHTESANELVRPGDARTKGLWGETHELGHNQQRTCWEFPPHTTECTCNLWSVYVHEEVLGVTSSMQAHSSMTLTKRKRRVDEYVKGGKKLSDWTIWVALETYLQLQGKFGWDAFKKVFAAYHKITNYPSDNDGKMNLYAVTFSQAVGMNLTGFFKAWGWPIDRATEKKLSNLPPWSDHPMV
uniref:Peptidase M60 domain-containing protein n=1 Tax=Sander lucioperca TaxID=283035 RepID=A0A8C9ZVJ9_SANLU